MKWFFIVVLVPAAVLIPLLAGGIRYKLLPAPAKCIVFYLLLGSIINLVAVKLAASHRNNLPLLHVYTVVEFVTLSLFYWNVLPGRRIHRLLLLCCILFVIACIVNACIPQHILSFNSYTRSAGALIIIGYALYFFNVLVDRDYDHFFDRLPLFWMNAGILLYFSGSLLLFLFHVFLMGHELLDIWAWRLHGLLVLIMYFLFTKGFLLCRK